MGRRLTGLGLATLATAVVALPAVAGSEPAPTVEAVNEPAGGSGRVLVSASGAVSPLPPSSPPGSGTQGSGSAAGEGSSTQGGSGGSPSSPGSGSGSTGPSSSPGRTLFVSGPHALELLRHEHGSSVSGSVAVSRAAAQGRLEVSLYADGASLQRANRAAQVRVGRRLLALLRAGDVAFAVTISPRARAALRRSGRLQLTLRLVLTPVHGSAQTLRRKLLLHT